MQSFYKDQSVAHRKIFMHKHIFSILILSFFTLSSDAMIPPRKNHTAERILAFDGSMRENIQKTYRDMRQEFIKRYTVMMGICAASTLGCGALYIAGYYNLINATFDRSDKILICGGFLICSSGVLTFYKERNAWMRLPVALTSEQEHEVFEKGAINFADLIRENEQKRKV